MQYEETLVKKIPRITSQLLKKGLKKADAQDVAMKIVFEMYQYSPERKNRIIDENVWNATIYKLVNDRAIDFFRKQASHINALKKFFLMEPDRSEKAFVIDDKATLNAAISKLEDRLDIEKRYTKNGQLKAKALFKNLREGKSISDILENAFVYKSMFLELKKYERP